MGCSVFRSEIDCSSQTGQAVAARTVILLIVAIELKVLFEFLISTFRLTIGLW